MAGECVLAGDSKRNGSAVESVLLLLASFVSRSHWQDLSNEHCELQSFQRLLRLNGYGLGLELVEMICPISSHIDIRRLCAAVSIRA